VLDPFAGAGTTGLAAQQLGRRSVLIELNADYARIIEARVGRQGVLDFTATNVEDAS
jgi:DNA modification methylase